MDLNHDESKVMAWQEKIMMKVTRVGLDVKFNELILLATKLNLITWKFPIPKEIYLNRRMLDLAVGCKLRYFSDLSKIFILLDINFKISSAVCLFTKLTKSESFLI